MKRISIEEAQELCEEQLAKLGTYGPEINVLEKKKKETSSRIKAHKSAVEKLGTLHREFEKEQKDREAKGKRDERAEEGCRWFVFLLSFFRE